MEQQVRRFPQTSSHEAKKKLFLEKIRHYRARASELMADESSTMPKSLYLENDENEKPTVEPISSPRSAHSDEVDSCASQANAKLSQALDLDESGKISAAISIYMEAADLYLKALKTAEEYMPSSSRMESVATVLKRRLESTFDRVQELKESSTTNSRQLSRKRSTSPVPSSGSSLTQEEISILMRSSMVAARTFLPWSETDGIELSKAAQAGGRVLYKDPDGFLPLNPKQKPRFRHWARPVDIVRLRERLGIARHQTPELVRSITPYTIKQQYVTDCSFIASLCICAAYERRFNKRLVTSILYPRAKNGSPMLSPEGKYMVSIIRGSETLYRLLWQICLRFFVHLNDTGQTVA